MAVFNSLLKPKLVIGREAQVAGRVHWFVLAVDWLEGCLDAWVSKVLRAQHNTHKAAAERQAVAHA